MTTLISRKLITDIRDLIESARKRVAVTVNQEMTLLYWHIGKRLREDILQSKRADYGSRVLSVLSTELMGDYGKGFNPSNLSRMMTLYEKFNSFEIFATLSQKLSWSHFVELMPVKNPLERQFYAEMAALDGWSVRTLQEKKGKMLYARTSISKKPHSVIKDSLSLIQKEGRITPDIILQDPYVMDFLNLPKEFTESQLETAILNEISRFLLEMGAGFSFISRQKRISVGNDDFYIDLLLYNRLLKRLIVVELKTTKFKPSYKGQMEFYLNWLDQHEKSEGEERPIGIILCAEKDEAQVKVFDLQASGIHVAEYLQVLPNQSLLEKKVYKLLSDSHKRKIRPNRLIRKNCDEESPG